MQIGKTYQHFEFFKQSKALKPAPCFFLFGPENFLKDKILGILLKKFSDPDSEQFDTVKLYADDTGAANIIEQLEMNPFLSDFKIVIIKNFEKLIPKDKDFIADYLNNPVETSVLVIDSERIDKRLNAYKTIVNNSISVQCKSPYGVQDILTWLRNELSGKNIKMDNETANLFANYIEPDYLIASNELEKLIIASKNKNIITKDDVAECVGRSRSNSIFDLQNALGRKNLKKSLIILENLLENNESPIFIISMLTNFYRNIWKILVLKENNVKNSEITSVYLKEIFYSFREDYLSFARNYNLSSLYKIFTLLLNTDISLKSIDVKEIVLLESLLFNICRIND
jgi:DNA polymerase III subunit delta